MTPSPTHNPVCSSRTFRFRRGLITATAVALLLAGCGDDDSSDADGTTTTSSPVSSTTTTPEGRLEQPAVWPAADVVFDTPEAAASDFVAKALGVDPVLGEFQAGDARSGEIQVFSPGEGGGARIERSVLALRQLGPDDGWFVLAAVNEHTSIATPSSGDEVAAESVTVTGEARGFEGNVVVSAFAAGTAEQLGQAVTQGGSFEASEPYSVTLDLDGVEAGDTVVLLVRGGTGLEQDPGEFSAIPILIGP
jgi:hypothetical protein